MTRRTTTPGAASSERDQRLKAALKANLARRKAQAKARSAGSGSGPGAGVDADSGSGKVDTTGKEEG